MSAYVNVSVHDDENVACEAIRGGIVTFAHFSASVGVDFEIQPAILRNVTERLVTVYDTKEHTQGNAAHVEMTDDEVIREAHAALKGMFGTVPAPKEALITRWLSDPWTYGSYSYVPIGSSFRLHHELSTPFQNKMFFAGEASTKGIPLRCIALFFGRSCRTLHHR